MDSPISIVIADDHPLYLKALGNILKAIPCIGTIYPAPNGNAAMELVRKHRPKMAIFDLNMPFLTGLQLTERLKCEFPEMHIMILSMRQDLPTVRQAIQLGVSAYLPKEAEIEEIEEAVQVVLDGNIYFPVKLAQRLALEQLKKPQSETFTDREWQVLQLIGQQYTSAQIAREMAISIRTVERLRSSILYKTGTHNASAAVLYAERHGLLSGVVT